MKKSSKITFRRQPEVISQVMLFILPLFLLAILLPACATTSGRTTTSSPELASSPVTSEEELPPPYTGPPLRIVVIPFYVEDGAGSKGGGSAVTHYRRILRFLNNQLVRHGFEVINPFAAEAKEAEYNAYMEKSQEDSALVCQEMCKKYATDVAYVVWLNVKFKRTDDGSCIARARLAGEGYDSASRDIGAGVSKTFKVTKSYCDDAIVEVEKEVADLVGRKLTAWSGRSGRHSYVRSDSGSYGQPGEDGGVLQRHTQRLENLINISLDGVTEYETAEVFGKVINTVRGVVATKRLRSKIVPDNPQQSRIIWQVTIKGTDSFRLESNVIKMINDVLDAGGEIRMKGVSYRYTAAEMDLLKGIRSGDSSSQEIHFVVDRELARDREFSDRHDPYKARKPDKVQEEEKPKHKNDRGFD